MLRVSDMRKLLFVTAMLAAACAEQVGPGTAPDEDEDSVWVPDPTDEGSVPSDTAEFTRERMRDPEPDVCSMLPADEGACTHACDPVALASFIPDGTCATFTCTLTDGSIYRTGGCNN